MLIPIGLGLLLNGARKKRSEHAEPQKQDLTNDNEGNTKNEHSYGGGIIPLKPEIFIQLPQTENNKKHADYYTHCTLRIVHVIGKIIHVISKWLRHPRAWIELLTVLFVGAYAVLTYKSVSDFELSERPWIGIGQLQIAQKLAPGQYMIVNVPEENGGKSPALFTVAWAVLFPAFVASKEGQALSPPMPSECAGHKRRWSNRLKGYILLPGIPVVFQSLRVSSAVLPNWAIDAVTKEGASVPTPIPSSQPQWFFMPDNAAPQGLRMVLTGCIEYFDEYRMSHRTTFCDILVPNDPPYMGPCDTDNEAD
jgi:hypothetical protein